MLSYRLLHPLVVLGSCGDQGYRKNFVCSQYCNLWHRISDIRALEPSSELFWYDLATYDDRSITMFALQTTPQLQLPMPLAPIA